MVPWVVMNRQPSRQAAQKSSSLQTLCLRVQYSGSFPPTPIVSTSYGHTSTTAVPQLLCNQSVTHSFHHDGGVYPPRCPVCGFPTFGTPLLQPCLELSSFFSRSCALFCTQKKLNSFLFIRLRTLCQKPPGGGGTPLSDGKAERQNRARQAPPLPNYEDGDVEVRQEGFSYRGASWDEEKPHLSRSTIPSPARSP
jgi:hypothetical protein